MIPEWSNNSFKVIPEYSHNDSIANAAKMMPRKVDGLVEIETNYLMAFFYAEPPGMEKEKWCLIL